MPEIVEAADVEAVRDRGGNVLREGLLVVAPTDTVYGVLADAFGSEATARLSKARGAGRDRPLTVLVRNPRQLTGLVQEVGEPAERLIAAYWPGALTIVFRVAETLAWDLGDTRGTVAVRMPDEPILYELVAEVGPLACSAACPAGGVPPRTVEEAVELIGGEVALCIDGGERAGEVSTIVDCSRGGAEVLRPGPIAAEDIERVATGEVDWGRPTEAGPPPVEDPGTPDGEPLEGS